MKPFLAYLRVSTLKQGATGLGIDAQRAAITAFTQGATCLGEYVEVESGKRGDRPQLMKAISHAKKAKCKLVIAKLDRLSRDPDFIGALMKDDIDFVAVDNPNATKFTIRIMSAVAEWEREQISIRTIAALEAKKVILAQDGRRLGNPRPEASLARGRATLSEKADEFNAPIRAIIQAHPGKSANAMAAFLNTLNVPTRRGGTWTAKQVIRVMA